jgi:glutamine amidotransferase
MCRLFGMSAGRRRVQATFWLLDAPDSLSAQSRRNPDGTGLGSYDEQGRPVIHKAPIAAFQDAEFAGQARSVRSRTFVAHVRFASTGGLTMANTHPFEQDGRLFAHNGVVGDLPRLESELGDAMSLVQGDTDSERMFALITREIARRDGDIAGGITAATTWIAANLPVFSLNLIVIDGEQLFALRYPDTHELHVLQRGAGGKQGDEPLTHRSSLSRVHAEAGADHPVAVVASERMDDDPGWRALDPGELLRVASDLEVSSTIALPDAPAHLLTLADLGEHARSSQAPAQA